MNRFIRRTRGIKFKWCITNINFIFSICCSQSRWYPGYFIFDLISIKNHSIRRFITSINRNNKQLSVCVKWKHNNVSILPFLPEIITFSFIPWFDSEPIQAKTILIIYYAKSRVFYWIYIKILIIYYAKSRVFYSIYIKTVGNPSHQG